MSKRGSLRHWRVMCLSKRKNVPRFRSPHLKVPEHPQHGLWGRIAIPQPPFTGVPRTRGRKVPQRVFLECFLGAHSAPKSDPNQSLEGFLCVAGSACKFKLAHQKLSCVMDWRALHGPLVAPPRNPHTINCTNHSLRFYVCAIGDANIT